MAEFRIPPPHTPIPPSSHQLESSEQHKKNVRQEEFDLLRIKIDQFIIMASNDPQVFENVFIQISNLNELMHSNILNVDQENIIILEMRKLDSELNNGSSKVRNLYDRISLFNSYLEENFPKIKAFNIVQSLKNNLCSSPVDDLPPMDFEEFRNFEKDILSFIRKDIEIFRVNNLFNILKTVNENFLYHPRRNYSDTVNQLKQVTENIKNGII